MSFKKQIIMVLVLSSIVFGQVEKKTAWYMEVQSLSTEDTLAVTAMQGIANREKPSLFIFTGDRHWVATFKRDRVRHSAEVLEKYRNCDDAWKDYLEQEHGFQFETLHSVDELVNAMGNKTKGVVLYDDSEPYHYVLATALASAYDLVPVTDKVLNKYPALNALPVKQNLLNKYETLLEAHKKIWEQTKDLVTKEAVYSVGAESHIYGLDMAVAQKMFVYRLSCDKNKAPDEAAMVEEIISSLKPMSPVWGWGEPSESILRDLASEAGGFVMCSCVPNTSFFWKLKPLRKNPFERNKPLPDFRQSKLKDKYYISFVVNEGDSIKAAAALMSYGMWLEPDRGKLPITWGVCPWLYENFPAMMEYYYKTATLNDSFSPATSGYGYFTQQLTPYLFEFAQREIPVNHQANMVAGMSWGCDKLDQKESGLRDRWFDSRKMLGYINETIGGDKEPYLHFTPENRPVIGVHWNLFYWWHRFGKLSEEEIYRKTAEQIGNITAKHEPPFFIPIYGGMPNWFSRLKEILGDEKYEYVLLDEMMYLAKKAGQIQITEDHVQLAPGQQTLDAEITVRNMGDKPYEGNVNAIIPHGWSIEPKEWDYPALNPSTGNCAKRFKITLPPNCTFGDYKIEFADSGSGMSDMLLVSVNKRNQ